MMPLYTVVTLAEFCVKQTLTPADIDQQINKWGTEYETKTETKTETEYETMYDKYTSNYCSRDVVYCITDGNNLMGLYHQDSLYVDNVDDLVFAPNADWNQCLLAVMEFERMRTFRTGHTDYHSEYEITREKSGWVNLFAISQSEFVLKYIQEFDRLVTLYGGRIHVTNESAGNNVHLGGKERVYLFPVRRYSRVSKGDRVAITFYHDYERTKQRLSHDTGYMLHCDSSIRECGAKVSILVLTLDTPLIYNHPQNGPGADIRLKMAFSSGHIIDNVDFRWNKLTHHTYWGGVQSHYNITDVYAVQVRTKYIPCKDKQCDYCKNQAEAICDPHNQCKCGCNHHTRSVCSLYAYLIKQKAGKLNSWIDIPRENRMFTRARTDADPEVATVLSSLDGYIYLVEMKCALTGDPIYKFGKTGRDDVLKRVNEYKPMPRLLLVIRVAGYAQLEKKILAQLRETAELCQGNEFFKGDREVIMRTVLSTV